MMMEMKLILHAMFRKCKLIHASFIIVPVDLFLIHKEELECFNLIWFDMYYFRK